MRALLSSLPLMFLVACSKPKPTGDAARELVPSASASAAPVEAPPIALPTAIAPAASSGITAPPTCLERSQKVWAKNPNKLTGLSVAELRDGRVAVGLAIGNTPHVLVVGSDGQGSLKKVAVAGRLAKEPSRAEGVRHIMRVTPVKVDGGEMHAFVDYHDELKDGRRVVACGPGEREDPWMGFSGVSLYEQKETDRPTGDELAARFKTKSPDGKERYREVRDCRTFVGPDAGESWIVGSELRGELEGAKPAWSMHLVAVDKASRGSERTLHETAVKDGLAKPTTYEVPQSARLADGSYVVVARRGAQLLATLTNADKTKKGDVRAYDGFPTVADIAEDGDDVVVSVAFGRAKGQYDMRAMRLVGKSPELPKRVTKVALDDDDEDSEVDPDFTRDSRGRRWLSYIDGERGKGHLVIGAIDANFRVIGRPYAVTEGDERASEARLVPIKDGAILVAYIRDLGGGTELVTEDLVCSVSK